jgi:hypothetical protein
MRLVPAAIPPALAHMPGALPEQRREERGHPPACAEESSAEGGGKGGGKIQREKTKGRGGKIWCPQERS